MAEFGLVFGLGFWGQVPLPALLFVVLVIRNCWLLSGKHRAVMTGLAFLSYVIVQAHRLFHQNLRLKLSPDKPGAAWVGYFLVFGLVLLFLHLLIDTVLKERQGHEQLAIANARLRQYALKVEELAIVQERNRIAREIHDSLGHSLTVFGIHLEAALRLFHANPEQAEQLLREIKQLNSQTLQDVRQSVSTLRADPLQGRALQTAIAALATELERSTGVVPHYRFDLARSLPAELNVAIYRIVQESLTNIRKYAAATKVEIAIEELANQIQVVIQDNGKGFDLSQNSTGFGLQGMQERTLALSGQLEIVTVPDQGCMVKVLFPYD
jgi:signal transduction histidine kinase